jgi:hypothetical protein
MLMQMLMRSLLSCLSVFLACSIAVANAQNDATPPAHLPDAMPGEQWIRDLDLSLNHQFAPVLPMNDGSALIFTRNDRKAEITRYWPATSRLQKIDTKGLEIPYLFRERYANQWPAFYRSVQTSAGIWLIGETVELLRPDNTRISGTLRMPRNEPKAVALPDGSILVMGSETWTEKDPSFTPKVHMAERLRLSADGKIVSEFTAPLPPCESKSCTTSDGLWSFSATYLGNGRVMFAGGYWIPQVYIYDATSDKWHTCPPMHEARSDFSLTTLPDGRVLAAGGKGAQSTELWDPKTEQWSMGPRLPIATRDHTALLLDKKTVVLAGGGFAGVLTWDIDTPQWQVAALHTWSRARGGVIAYGGDKLAIIGGLHADSYGQAYGYSTPGISIVSLTKGAERAGLPVDTINTNGAFALRGEKLFTAGGASTSYFDGSEWTEGTSIVELDNLRNDKVQTLPPLPIAANFVQAFWIDDTRILALARDNAKASWFGIIDSSSGRQTASPLPKPSMDAATGNLAGLKLVGVHNGIAWLVSDQADVHKLDIAANKISDAPRMQRQRQQFSARVLGNGKIVVAGGVVESEIVLSRDENCPRCPERYIGFGQLLPSRRHEIFDPATSQWTSSAPSRAQGGPVAILADGRVAKLGVLTQRQKDPTNPATPITTTGPLLEISDADGAKWHTLTLPPPLQSAKDRSNEHDRIVAITGSEGLLDNTLLYGIANDNGETEWWSIDVSKSTVTWQRIGVAPPPFSFMRNATDSGQRSARGHRIFLVGSNSAIGAFEKLGE